MTVYDFVELLTDDCETVAVWDYRTEEEVFKGSAREASWDFGEYEILGIDLVPKCAGCEEIVILNIETEEED